MYLNFFSQPRLEINFITAIFSIEKRTASVITIPHWTREETKLVNILTASVHSDWA